MNANFVSMLPIVLTWGLINSAYAQGSNSKVDELRAQIESLRNSLDSLSRQLEEIEKQDKASADDSTTSPELEVGPAEIISLDALSNAAPLGPDNHQFQQADLQNTASFGLVAGTGGGRASFSLNHSYQRDKGPPNNGELSVLSDSVALIFSAPLAKSGSTPFATLDGLSNGTKFEASFSQFRGKLPTANRTTDHPVIQKARVRCANAMPPYKNGCQRVDDEFLKMFLNEDERETFERDLARQTLQKSFSWTVRAAVGYDEYEFYPVPILSKSTEKKLSWSLGAGVIFYPLDQTSALFELGFQRAYESSKSATVCPLPMAPNTIVTCVSGPMAAPKLVDKFIVAPELRFFLPISDNGIIRDVGFAPRVEYDFLSDNASFDMPIYLVADDKGGLVGGLRVGYLTRDSELKIGVFIDKRFSIFK